MIRRLGAVMGVAAMVALTACATAVAGSPAAGGGAGGSDSSNPSSGKGFDECGVVELAELAEWVGTDAMFVSSAEVNVGPDGTKSATCAYYPRNIPGATGLKLTFVPDADPDTFFEQWETNYQNRLPLEIGDRAEAVALSSEGIDLKIYLVHAIKGTQGVDLFYSFSEKSEPGGMPVVEEGADRFGTMLNAVYERLPEELDIQDGKPEGACADIDLDLLSGTLQADLTTARTTQGDDGAIDCTFGGASGFASVSYMVPGKAPENMTHQDVGDGALIRVDEPGGGESQGDLNAWVAVGENLLRIRGSFGEGVSGITAPRPEDVELVRAIVEAVGGQD